MRITLIYYLIATHKVNEREIFIYAWEKGKREFAEDGGIKKGNKVHPTLIRIAFKQCFQGGLPTVDSTPYTTRVAPFMVTG